MQNCKVCSTRKSLWLVDEDSRDWQLKLLARSASVIRDQSASLISPIPSLRVENSKD
jgi:hypothetical protein